MENTIKIAVVLAGCGTQDGAEIHEAVMTLLAIKKQGAVYEIFAPDVPQHYVINHLTGKESKETRNVLVEAARIARGKIKPLSEYRAENYSALIFPGGFGVAKNLCTYYFEGAKCEVNEDVVKAIESTVNLQKPIGALCISPVLLAKTLGDVEITIGHDEKTIKNIEKMGATHQNATHTEVVIDKKHKLVTSPCYMLDADIVQIAQGAENVVKAIIELINE